MTLYKLKEMPVFLVQANPVMVKMKKKRPTEVGQQVKIVKIEWMNLIVYIDGECDPR